MALWASTSMASNASRLSAHSGSHRFHPSSAVHPSLCPCPVSHRLGKPNSGWGAPPACFRHLSEPPLTFFKLLQFLSPWGSPLCPVSPRSTLRVQDLPVVGLCPRPTQPVLLQLL